VPASPPNLILDGEYVVTSTEALSFSEVPGHLLVVGGGVIGLELGSVWNRLGSKVTVVEFTGKICGAMDGQMTKELEKILTKQGISFLLNSAVLATKVKKGVVEVSVKNNLTNEEYAIEADRVLVAVGRKAFSDGLGLKEAGVNISPRGVVVVNEKFETNIPGVYAIGDLIHGPMLAHKAEEEGVAVAEILATGHGHVNYETVPWVVYTWPELAGVGKTEEELKAEGVEYSVGTFPFMANGRAKALGTTEGMVKVIADKKTDRVLGVHVLGPRASDVIAEAVMAMEFGASSEDIARAFHGHPTLSEVMREAALNVTKRARQA
jgi:dihydrolipoamide dehydrogenase